ncbi:MAG: beta strand repeat-containing protein [Phycisphaerae bacterium]
MGWNSGTRVSGGTIRSAAVIAALGFAASRAGALVINQWVGSGTDNYNVAGNWSQGRVPNSGDQATLYSGDLTLYATPTNPGGMLVSSIFGAGEFNTGNYKITVAGDINVDAGGNFYVFDASSAGGGTVVSAVNLNVTQNSIYHNAYPGAHTEISGNTTVDATSQLWVESLFNDNSGANGTVTINGMLKAYGGTLNADTFTLAGTSSNAATINVNGSNLTINASTFNMGNTYTNIDASGFASHLTLNNLGSNLTLVNANVTLGDSAHLSMPGGSEWMFGNIFLGITAGSVNLNGGNTTARAATVDQYAFYESLVNVTGFAKMVSGEFDGGSVVNIAANGTLTVGSPYFRGVTHNGLFGPDTYTTVNINGNGTMAWSGDAAIGYSNPNVPYTAVNVNVPTLNWSTGANTSLDIQNGELNVYSTSLQNRLVYNGIFFVPTNGYDGNMTVEGGAKLNVVNAAWTLFGTMTLGPGAVVQGQTITVNSGSLPLGTYSLYPTYSGSTFPSIQAPLVLQSNSYVYLGFNGGVHFDGNTTYAGGSIVSAPYVMSPYGIVVQNGNATVTGNSSIFCNTFDMDGAANSTTWTIGAGATLTQQAWYLDPGSLTINPIHSTITINGGTLHMETNSGQWTLVGGTLNMNGSGINLPFVTHDLLVLGLGVTNGTVNVGAGTSAYISGGVKSAANTVVGGNVVNVGAGSTLYVGPFFGSEANATLTKMGPGTLQINAATQSHGVGATINVNQGELDLNTDAGQGGANLILNVQGTATFGSTQHLKTVHVMSGGTAMLVTGGVKTVRTANLTIDGGLTPIGTLNITTQKMIVEPGAGKAVVLAELLAQAAYGRTHSTGIVDTLLPAGYGVAVVDNALVGKLTFGGVQADGGSILISQELLGDANIDGKVDLTDLSTVLNNFGVATNAWTSGNFDGAATINLTDLSDVLNNFGVTNPNASDVVAGGAVAAAPEPGSVAGLVVGGLLLLRRRRR